LASSGVPVNIRFEAATFNASLAKTMPETVIGFDIENGCMWPMPGTLSDEFGATLLTFKNVS
jgi:hypothetical protein